jgi:polysaccharide pyruvyl transferase WcaK-like protein
MKFAIIGSALAGNKGAAAMLESSIQTLGKKYPDAEFVLLSVYPEEDKKLNIYDNLTILPATAKKVGLVMNPLAVLYKIMPPLRNTILLKSPQLRAIKEADVLLDQGGITFTDGREVFLLYNVASILPAMMVGTKVVKCAQALGPFNNPINKMVSRLVLPRVKLIIARGEKTFEHLNGLGLKNFKLATDYAFSLDISEKDEKDAKAIYKELSKGIDFRNKQVVGISPSVVVEKKCLKKSIDYISLMQWFISDLISKGNVVVLLPHSVRSDVAKKHNNDLPLCQNIYDGLDDKSGCVFINREVSSQALRYIIGQTDLFIACRFHAMISSLSMSVPTMVLGWSHKYMEILDLFGVKEYGLDSSKLSKKLLTEKFNELERNKESIKKKLDKELPNVKKLSMSHVDLIDKAIK